MTLSPTPIISVITPAYNCAAYLEQTVQSIREQDFQNWEQIIVNDGSTDETGVIAERLAATDARIRVIHQENGRQGKARNNALRNATGQYIAFLDGDDLWLSNKLSRQLDMLHETGADLIFSNGYICLQNNMADERTAFGTRTGWLSGREAVRLFYAMNQIPVSTVLCTATCLKQVGFFDETPEIQNCEDYDIWIRLLKAGARFYGIPDKLLRYRMHPASSTSAAANRIPPIIHLLLKHKAWEEKEGSRHLLRLYQDLADLSTKKKNYRQFRELLPFFIDHLAKGRIKTVLPLIAKLNIRRAVGLVWRFCKKNGAGT